MSKVLKISEEETRRLIAQYQELSPSAGAAKGEILEKLVDGYMPLIETMAYKVYTERSKNYQCDYDDFKQEATLAFINSLSRYDLENGSKLSTYLYSMLSHELFQYHRNSTYGSGNRSFSEMYYKIFEARNKLQQKLGRSATLKEISAETKIPVEKVRSVILVSGKPVSIDTVVSSTEDGYETTVADTIADDFENELEKQILIKDREALIEEVLDGFSEEDKQLFREINGLNGEQKSFRALAEELNISKSTLNRRYNAIAAGIKEKLSGFSFEDFFAD